MDSLSQNIKFKRMVKFALHVLNETITDEGTSNRPNSAYITFKSGYKQIINTLKTYTGDEEFVK